MNLPIRRTLVLGLDGFDLNLAMRLANQGELPWLRGQLQQASRVFTHCATLPGSEWVNAACGVSAAGHRYLHTSQLRVGTYEEVETDAGIVEAQPFYVPLAQSGRKTIIVDLPVDRPRPTKNLMQVVDWATEFKLWRYTTTPKSVRRFVEQTSPGNPFTNYGITRPDDVTLLELRRQLALACTLKGRLIKELMRTQDDWSMLFAGFGELHKAGHFFWQYQDPSHPNYAGADHPLASALVELYQQLDRELAVVCASAGEGGDVVVVADRGMRANFRGDHLMVPFLQRLGLYGRAAAEISSAFADTEEQRSAFGKPEPLLRRIKRRVPVAIRPLMRRLAGFELDWDDIKVFPMSEVGNSYFRVNLRGREPRGTVSAGFEYEALLERLCAEFESLVNPSDREMSNRGSRFSAAGIRGAV